MRVTCSSCSANYTIADDKVRNKHVKLRCKKCGSTIVVDGKMAGDSQGNVAPAPERETVSLHPVASDAPSELWTVNLSDEDEREMTFGQVVAGYLDGTVTDDAFVWKEGMSDWMPVMAVPELKDAIDATRAGGKSSPQATTAGKVPAVAVKSSPTAAKVSPRDNLAPSAQPGSIGAAGAVVSGGAEASKPSAKIGAKAVATKGMTQAARATDASRTTAAPKGSSASTAGPERGKGKGSAAGPQNASKPPVATSQRASASKQSNVADLFGAAAKAGSEEEATAASTAEAAKSASTGTRNENSVLFSLDALKAGFAAAGTVPKPQTIQPTKTSLDAIMSIPGPANPKGVLGFGTADLLTAPAPPPPPPPPEPVRPKVVEPEAKSVAANLPPPAPAASSKRNVLIAAIVLLGLAGLGGLVATRFGGGDAEKQVAKLEERQKQLEEKLQAERKAAKEAEAAAERAKAAADDAARKAGEGASGPEKLQAEPAKSDKDAKEEPSKVASSRWSGTGAAPTKPGKDDTKPVKPAETATGKKEGASVTVSTTPSSGVSSFDKGAARSALSVAASGAAGCKKGDGPTGAGKVMVTFAPSGRVTSANVVGPPFAGTSVGGCVATIFRRATVPPFSGDPVTVAKSFSIQ